jgi:predicted RND superfamily exporter protein
MRTVIGSALAVLLVLVLTFGGFRSPSILIVSIAVAILWTAAGARMIWGSLSALGLTFASILIGLGVDYGIHGLTVFPQRRASGDRPQLA